MFQFAKWGGASKALRALVMSFVALLLVLQTTPNAFAGTTGIISGTVTDSQTHAPLANVKVTAAAPTGSYHATTNSRGFYTLTGVYSDTYAVSYQIEGYEPASIPGVTVFADQTLTLDQPMAKTLKTIAKVTSRSSGSAFQPRQATDTYNVTQQQIQSINGNAINLSESNLITSLPGGSFDSSGYPVIRGGRENEENFEFEGVPYTDAFTNQFTNTLAAPGLGLQSIQLTPGLGDASQDNYGTGTFNLVAKRGSYPGFATVQAAVGGPSFRHALNFEYGFASPNGRFSNYSTLAVGNRSSVYGSLTTDANSIGAFFGRRYSTDREFIDNFVYRFGANNNMAVQLFTDVADHHFYNGYGGMSQFCFRTCDPLFDSFAISLNRNMRDGTLMPTGGTMVPTQANPYGTGAVGLLGQLMTLDPHQTSAYQKLGSRALGGSYQPNAVVKLGYTWNINSSTMLQAIGYRTNAVTIFDQPLRSGYSSTTSSYVSQQGGQSAGTKIDLTKTLSDKHLVKTGVAFRLLHPVFDSPPANYGLFMSAPAFGGGYFNPATGAPVSEFLDFATPAQCQQFLGFTAAKAAANCGYIYQFGSASPAAGTKIPTAYENTSINRQDYTYYITDEWTPNEKLKVSYGVRVDEANYQYPAAKIDPFTCTSDYNPTYISATGGPTTNPTVFPQGCPVASFNLTKAEKRPVVPEPVIAASLRMGLNDSIRASYGRSVEFPLLSDVDLTSSPAYYSSFAGIPAHPGAMCGILSDQQCTSYAQELHWRAQYLWAGSPPIQPVRPTTYTNLDFSWAHQFTKGALAGMGFKLTPFWRKAHDEVALISSPLYTNGVLQTDPITGNPLFGPSVATNQGVNQVTGAEFQLTKETPYGLSGQISMTYQNEFSSVVPLSGSEDFFPSISASSLALGNSYRVGFLSPFVTSLDLSYRTHNGWRIAPQVQYNVGYPNSPGLLGTGYINGKPYNVPNTNAASGLTGAPFGTTLYVDPLNPGSYFSPNIAATRGIDAKSSPGGILSHPSSVTNLTIEYDVNKKMTAGFQVFNVFNNLWGGASYNARYQPLATGISGPLTGQTSTAYTLGPAYGVANYGLNRRGNQPYIDTQNGLRSYYVYTTIKL